VSEDLHQESLRESNLPLQGISQHHRTRLSEPPFRKWPSFSKKTALWVHPNPEKNVE